MHITNIPNPSFVRYATSQNQFIFAECFKLNNQTFIRTKNAIYHYDLLSNYLISIYPDNHDIKLLAVGWEIVDQQIADRYM